MLRHHTFLAEFHGDTPEDIILALHRHSHQGTGETLDQWWSRQQQLWSARYGARLPGRLEPHSAERMLEVLIAVGAVEAGSSPTPIPVITKDTALAPLPVHAPSNESTRRLGEILRRSLFD